MCNYDLFDFIPHWRAGNNISHLVVGQVDGSGVLRQLGEVRQAFVRTGNGNSVTSLGGDDQRLLDVFQVALAVVLDGAGGQDVERVVLHDQEQASIVGAALVATPSGKITFRYFVASTTIIIVAYVWEDAGAQELLASKIVS